MDHHPSVQLDADRVGNFNDLGEAPERTALIAGIVIIVLAAFLSVPATESLQTNWTHFLFAYLVNFTYVTSICVGGLFFVALQYITRAGWSVVVRRMGEVIALGVLPCAILFMPILGLIWSGYQHLYPWNSPELVAMDPLVAHKAAWLNPLLFSVRGVVYFVIWIGLTRLFFSKSRQQDESGQVSITNQMEGWSALAIFLFAVTVTFASFDWIMSLDKAWFSTIFGIYYFAGCLVGFFSTLNLVVLLMLNAGVLQGAVTEEHRHNLGKCMFFATCFWGYIAFSQYLLYWYANIPEETGWYLLRQQGGWGFLAYVLIFGHFAIPFLGMMPKSTKKNSSRMIFWSVYLLAMHWLDLYWQIMPNAGDAAGFGITEIMTLVGMICIVFAGIMWQAGRSPLIAVRDPRLQESLEFHDI